MATETKPTTRLPAEWSLADLQKHLGDIPPERIRVVPPPGTATVEDVVYLDDHEDRLCELIDGVLVEKAVGWYESQFAITIAHFLKSFLDEHDLGVVAGADGTLQVLPDQVRIPDISFVRWEHFPDGKIPREPVPRLAPNLAVEVLSKSNTEGEMRRKLQDYFSAGVELVWFFDPQQRNVTVYTSPDDFDVVPEEGTLDGGSVLPGFQVNVKDLYAEADRTG